MYISYNVSQVWIPIIPPFSIQKSKSPSYSNSETVVPCPFSKNLLNVLSMYFTFSISSSVAFYYKIVLLYLYACSTSIIISPVECRWCLMPTIMMMMWMMTIIVIIIQKYFKRISFPFSHAVQPFELTSPCLLRIIIRSFWVWKKKYLPEENEEPTMLAPTDRRIVKSSHILLTWQSIRIGLHYIFIQSYIFYVLIGAFFILSFFYTCLGFFSFFSNMYS